jgi:hypothetical protein
VEASCTHDGVMSNCGCDRTGGGSIRVLKEDWLSKWVLGSCCSRLSNDARNLNLASVTIGSEGSKSCCIISQW